MILHRLYIILILCFCSLFINAQSEASIHKEADKLMGFNFPDTYKSALDLLIGLDEKNNGSKPLYRYKIAICYLKTNINKKKALDYLLSIKRNEEEFGYGYYYYLGLAYHYSYQFDNAITAFNQFISLSKRKDKRRKEVLELINTCKYAKELYNNPLDVNVINLGSMINSDGSDNTPVIAADETILLFTSRRSGSIGGLMNVYGKEDKINGDYFEDIFVSYKVQNNWLRPMNIGSQINTKVHDAVIGLSPDGQRMYVYKSDNNGMGNIFFSDLNGDKWKKPEKMPNPINSNYWEGSCSVTSDGKEIYFSSNRPGGFGGKDIYMCRKLPDGNWGQPINLGSTINTTANEDAPFIHVDGKTLYFSSKGHSTMGGYDVFKAVNENGTWSEVVNMQYPINTTEDDINFVLSADGSTGYYSCTKEGGFGNQDIYLIDLNNANELRPDEIVLVVGKVYGQDGEIPQDAKLYISSVAGEEIGTYKINQVTGKYLSVIPKSGSYNFRIVAPGYKDNNYLVEVTNKELNKNFTLYKL